MKLQGISKEGLKRIARKVKAQGDPPNGGDLNLQAPEEDNGDAKIQALAEYLSIDVEDITNEYGDEFSTPEGDYRVLTDEEADESVAEYIEDSLWAFNAEFIVENSDLPYEAVEMVRGFQEAKSEGANETIRAMIKDMEYFVEAAISADGRGHFLNHYDGSEDEQNGFYIYRTN